MSTFCIIEKQKSYSSVYTLYSVLSASVWADLSEVWIMQTKNNFILTIVWCFMFFHLRKISTALSFHTSANPVVRQAFKPLLENQYERSIERELPPPWLNWFSLIFIKEVAHLRLDFCGNPNGPTAHKKSLLAQGILVLGERIYCCSVCAVCCPVGW